MRHCLSKKCAIACIACFLCSGFWACKDEPPPKPQVVRKKIAFPEKSVAKKPATKKPGQKAAPAKKPDKVITALAPKSDIAKPTTTPTPKSVPPTKSAQVQEQKTSAPPPRPKTPSAMVALLPKSDLSQPSKEEKPAKDTLTAKSDIADAPGAGPAPKAEPITETVSIPPAAKSEPFTAKLPSDQTNRYDPTGKLDPFEPPFKEQVAVAPKKKKRRTPRTPLEKIALSQLKLVGIVLSPQGNRALVQEASGKGYVIKKGTYLGLNSGRVVAITKDTLVIEEEIENILGKVTIQKKEMTLPKPPGEF